LRAAHDSDHQPSNTDSDKRTKTKEHIMYCWYTGAIAESGVFKYTWDSYDYFEVACTDGFNLWVGWV
jgi:hypothetical protein